MRNEVEYQDSDVILREEADCRLGQNEGGQAVNPNCALCQSVLGQVVRNPPTDLANPSGITSVLVLPINAAVDKTSELDVDARYGLEAGRAGTFEFQAGFTNVLTHTIQLFPGDPVDNELADWYYYVISRTKASYCASWTLGSVTTTIHGQRLRGLPNYDGTQRLGAPSLYNASLNYRLDSHATFTFIVDNLFDKKPYRDSTWTGYPFDVVVQPGRTGVLRRVQLPLRRQRQLSAGCHASIRPWRMAIRVRSDWVVAESFCLML